jgi:hypothetical protein
MTKFEGIFSMTHQFLGRSRPVARAFGAAAATALCLLIPAGGAKAGCSAEGVKLIKHLNGSWSGAGTMTPIGGEKARISCRVRYKGEGDRLSQTVKCKGGAIDIDASSSLSCDGSRIEGSWTESIANNTGSVRGAVGANRMDVNVEGPNFNGRFSVRLAGSRHTVTITEFDPAKGRHVPVATMSLSH